MAERYTLEKNGFEVIEESEGMSNAAAHTKGCSGKRSDCCTRVCGMGETFVASNDEWAKFLDVQGGQIQY